MSETRSIVTAGETGARFAVGSDQNVPSGGRVGRITVEMRHGQMSMVPWYLVWVDGVVEVEVNAAHVEYAVVREANGG